MLPGTLAAVTHTVMSVCTTLQVSGLPREAPCAIGIDCNITTEEILRRLSSESLIAAPWTYPSYRYSCMNHSSVTDLTLVR